MEAIFFAIDIVGMILLLYWSIINDDRKPGTPTTGLFAYHETIGRIKAAAGRSGRPGPTAVPLPGSTAVPPPGSTAVPPLGSAAVPPRRNR